LTMTLVEIGQQLKSARDIKGLSLSQIQERTKIPYNHLQAIDNGQQEDLPESVYVTGYIKRYAECVGLDGQHLADAFRLALENSNHKNGRFLLFSKPPKLEPVKIPTTQNYQRVRIDQAPPSLLKSVPFYAIWIIVVLGLVVYLAAHQQGSEMQDSAIVSLKDSTDKLHLDQQAKAPLPNTSLDQSSTTPSEAAASSSNDVRIVLNASQHVWVEVKSASTGEVQYTGFLEMGDRRDFHDPQGLEIESRDAGSLTVERDGKIEAFGPSGKDVQKTYLAKGANPETHSSLQTEKAAKSLANGSTITATVSKKAPPPKRSATKTATQEKGNTGSPSRQYVPGDFYGQNGNNSRGMDVPYRYSE
jgi:cytoskeleton protein RodZ